MLDNKKTPKFDPKRRTLPPQASKGSAKVSEEQTLYQTLDHMAHASVAKATSGLSPSV